jgi:hypothetical protein
LKTAMALRAMSGPHYGASWFEKSLRPLNPWRVV